MRFRPHKTWIRFCFQIMHFTKKSNFYSIGLKPLFLTTHRRVRPGKTIIDAFPSYPSLAEIKYLSLPWLPVVSTMLLGLLMSFLLFACQQIPFYLAHHPVLFFRQSCNLKTPSTTERTASVYIDIAAPRFAFHSFFTNCSSYLKRQFCFLLLRLLLKCDL